ncbi:MAG: pseudaminic acid biosynthesis-associated methylase [Phenylobacterium sp.]
MSETKLTPKEAWAGAFGAAYTERNVADAAQLRDRTRMWAVMGRAFAGAPPRSMLEVGCNLGINLRVLPALWDVELHAIEPNPQARERIIADKVLPAERLYAGFGDSIPVADGAVELAFTTGVLIHVDPAQLPATMDEIHRVSSRYILCSEYFSPKAETITYQGQEGLLFKNDFGGLYMDRFPGLKLLDYGFFWKRVAGGDNATWWLFEKG